MPSKIKDTEIGFQGQHFYAGMDGHEERWLVTVQQNGLRSESNAPEDFDGYEDGESCPEAGTDSDSNDVPDDEDNCPSIPNPGWEENDNDGTGDICDSLGGPIPTMFGWGIMLT